MQEQIWFGKYRIVKLLGQGATSKVFLAVYDTLGQERAIKCISKKNQNYEQVKQEVNLLIHLKSPAIPMIYDVEENEENLYIIEEYMEGESLFTYRNRTQRLSEKEILELSLQICNLIHYLHSMQIPILYLDFKPSNFILKEGKLKLVDFGSARQKHITRFGANYATKGFAAPEQYRRVDLDEETDIYGIGMLMYFLMTGTDKRGNATIYKDTKAYGYSKELVQLVVRAIHHNPCERYASVKSLEQKLWKLSRKQPVANASKTIALIGSQRGVGVTHLAFYLTSQLQRCGKRVLYVECGISNIVTSLIQVGKLQSEGLVVYKNCFFTRAEWMNRFVKTQFDYIIYDYGTMDEERFEAFGQAELRIAVLGAREWEWSYSQKLVARLCHDSKVRFILNHITALGFRQLVREWKGVNALRMPLEVDVFSKTSAVLSEFVMAVLE